MFDPATSLLSKFASSAVWRAISSIWKRFKRPSFELDRAPENIFQHIRPHTSLSKAREILGTPIVEYPEYQSFKFSDAFIQIGITKTNTVKYICLVIPKSGRRTTFRVYPLEFVLGKSTIQDVSLVGDPIYEFDSSSKHWHIWTKQYFGYDGNYMHYEFGVLGAPNIHETPIRWKMGENEIKPVILSLPNEIIPNIVCVSSEQDFHPSFNYWAFH